MRIHGIRDKTFRLRSGFIPYFVKVASDLKFF